MEALVLTDFGVEEIAAQEVGELIQVNPIKHKGYVRFAFNNIDKLSILSYRAQSIYRVLLILQEFSFTDLGDLVAKIVSVNLKEWIQGSYHFVCNRHGVHDFNSQDVISKIRATFYDSWDFKSQVIFNLQIFDNNAFVTLDWSGFELGKRDYHVFPHAASVKPPIFYACLRLLGYRKKLCLVNVFCRSGAFVVEAAFFAAKFPPNFYRKSSFVQEFDFSHLDKQISKDKLLITGVDSSLPNVVASRKNAKIAGVTSMVNFIRADLDWLETKFKQGEVDILFSYLPGKNVNTRELFYQAEFLLSNNGRLGILLNQDLQIFNDKFSLFSTNKFVRGETYFLKIFKPKHL